MARKPKSGGVAGEVIICILSAFLVAFGVAGFLATDTVKSGFNALQDANSGAAIITDSGIVTENGVVSVSRVKGIVNNFLLVSMCASVFGIVVVLATIVRLKKKR